MDVAPSSGGKPESIKNSEKPTFLSVPETDVNTKAPRSESDSLSPSIILTLFPDTNTNMVKTAITEIQ